jgi:hypothetical protein
MLPKHNIIVPLGRKHIATWVGAIAALNLFVLVVMYLHLTRTLPSDWRVRYIARQFSLAPENNLAVWYSSMLLLLVSLGAIGCFVVEFQQRPPGRERVLTYGWAMIALLFLGLSLDELGSIHERIPTLGGLHSPFSGLRGWVGVLAVPIALVGLFVMAFAALRVRLSPAASVLMLLGLLLFLSIPIQEHVEVEMMGASDSPEPWKRPVGLAILEEGTEIFGSLCFFASTLMYLRMLAGRFTGATGDRAAEEQVLIAVRPWLGAAAVALLAIGLLVVEFGLLPFTASRPNWGIPRNWFASALAFAAALIGLELWRTTRRTPHEWGVSRFLMLALLCLVVSSDHGSAHAFTQRLWMEHPTRSLQVHAVYALAVLISAAAVIRQPFPSRIRWSIGLWAVLLAAGILTRGAALVPLSLAAFAILVPTLLHALFVVSGPHLATDGLSQRLATADISLGRGTADPADPAERAFLR